jgi:DNA-binding response OmpR family regulator
MSVKTVLILEDDLMLAESLKLDLEAIGLRVLGPAPDCSAALELLLRERPDLAILDTHLGTETCEVVIDECNAQAVPVVISSGHAADELPTFAMGLPLLGKPYLTDALPSLVARVQTV